MITRFCPTASGDARVGILHLGHLGAVLINERLAHSVKYGRFIVRFDDNQQRWIDLLGKDAMAANCEQIQRELDWLGIQVDEWVWQSRMEWVTHPIIAKLGEKADVSEHVAKLLGADDPQYPFVSFLTAESVVLDHISGITDIIVGHELATRSSLYAYFERALGLPYIQDYYMPRLKEQGAEIDEVSKTRGNWKIKRFMDAGFHPQDVIGLVERCYLIEPGKGWALDNIKAQPLIELKESNYY